MPGLKFQRAQKLISPVRKRLARARINQIERNPLKIIFGDVKRLQRLVGCVKTAKRLEVSIIQRLNTERYAVDASSSETLEAICLDACRVGFQSDFGVSGNAPVFGDPLC